MLVRKKCSLRLFLFCAACVRLDLVLYADRQGRTYTAFSTRWCSFENNRCTGEVFYLNGGGWRQLPYVSNYRRLCFFTHPHGRFCHNIVLSHQAKHVKISKHNRPTTQAYITILCFGLPIHPGSNQRSTDTRTVQL